MKQVLLENNTTVFYTVRVGEDLYVKNVDFYSGKVDQVAVTSGKGVDDARLYHRVWKVDDLVRAEKVAEYVSGTILKHTKVTTVTDSIEEVKGQ